MAGYSEAGAGDEDEEEAWTERRGCLEEVRLKVVLHQADRASD